MLIETGTRNMIHSLKQLGARRYNLHLPEVKYIVSILNDNEVVMGIAFGKYNHSFENLTGRGALVATNMRILLVDRKPLFDRYENIPYSIINGITYSHAPFGASIILETRAGDISILTFCTSCAKGFVKAVEGYLSSLAKNQPF